MYACWSIDEHSICMASYTEISNELVQCRHRLTWYLRKMPISSSVYSLLMTLYTSGSYFRKYC